MSNLKASAREVLARKLRIEGFRLKRELKTYGPKDAALSINNLADIRKMLDESYRQQKVGTRGQRFQTLDQLRKHFLIPKPR
jgi:hypothetical protein